MANKIKGHHFVKKNDGPTDFLLYTLWRVTHKLLFTRFGRHIIIRVSGKVRV